MVQKNYFLISGILFSLVAAAHLLRIICGISVRVGAYEVPILVSSVGFIVPAALAFWAFRLRRAQSTT